MGVNVEASEHYDEPNVYRRPAVVVRLAGQAMTRRHLPPAVWCAHSDWGGHELSILVAHLRKTVGHYNGAMSIRTAGSLGYRLALSGHAKPVANPPVTTKHERACPGRRGIH